MIRIFISHAGPDSTAANQLADDLKNAGHETKIDTRELGLGDDTIDFMNDGISEAHVVLILHSAHTPNAIWQKLELNAAIWNEVAQSGGKCIVLRLDETPIPPLLGPKVFGKLNLSDKTAYRELLEKICQNVMSEKPVSSTYTRR